MLKRRVPDVRQQVIEIFDARLILRRFVGARLVTESAVARGLQFEDRWTDQLASAVELVLGLRLYRETHGLCDQPLAGTADHDAWPEDAAVTVDDDPRIGWLAEVARLAESSSVSEIASMLEASSVDQRCPPASV